MIKIAILCNSRLGIPSIQMLAASGQLTACATSENAHEDNEELAYFCSQAQIPFRTFSRTQVKNEMSAWLAQFQAEAVFVFTFPYRIPETLLNKTTYGFINFHFGLLPEYRGSDAIFWQLKNRENKGGITIHQMTADFDKGPVYIRKEIPIQAEDSYGMHVNNLAMTAPGTIYALINMLKQGIQPSAQDENKAQYFRRPGLKDVFIDWTKSAAEIIALINACNPWNRGALTSVNQFPFRVLSASVISTPYPGQFLPGQILSADHENGLCIACGTNEQLRLDICLINNEFVGTRQMSRVGLRKAQVCDLMNYLL